MHKERVNITKKLVSFPYFCGRSSNEHLASEKANEQNQTIGTVTMQLEPGSSVYEAGKQEGKFNEVNASAFAARKTPLEGQTAAAGPYLLAGTNLTTSTFLGLPNTISTVANEINRTTFRRRSHMCSMRLHCFGRDMTLALVPPATFGVVALAGLPAAQRRLSKSTCVPAVHVGASRQTTCRWPACCILSPSPRVAAGASAWTSSTCPSRAQATTFCRCTSTS